MDDGTPAEFSGGKNNERYTIVKLCDKNLIHQI